MKLTHIIYSILFASMILFGSSQVYATGGEKAKSESIEMRGKAKAQCAQFDVIGNSTQKYDTNKACVAGKGNLNKNASGDALARCSTKCEALGCTYTTVPAKPIGVAGRCVKGSQPKTFYGSSSAKAVCKCIEK